MVLGMTSHGSKTVKFLAANGLAPSADTVARTRTKAQAGAPSFKPEDLPARLTHIASMWKRRMQALGLAPGSIPVQAQEVSVVRRRRQGRCTLCGFGSLTCVLCFLFLRMKLSLTSVWICCTWPVSLICTERVAPLERTTDANLSLSRCRQSLPWTRISTPATIIGARKGGSCCCSLCTTASPHCQP